MNATDIRNRFLTRRLLALTIDDRVWVMKEAETQLLNDPFDNLDFMDFLENALDLAEDPTYIRD